MAHLNKKCTGCGMRFSYCPDCSRADALKPSWASEFCSEPCATLWTTLTKYNMSMLSKSEAKSIISALELKPIDSYASCVQRDYAIVMAEEKKPKRGKRVEIQPVDEKADIPTEVIDSVIEELTEQPIVAEQMVTEPVHEVILQEDE